jgi:hypothetical protein
MTPQATSLGDLEKWLPRPDGKKSGNPALFDLHDKAVKS